MADIPEWIENELKEGFLSHEAANWWREDAPDELRDDVTRGLDAGQSVEWSLLMSDAGINPDPGDWDSVHIAMYGDGHLDVTITEKDGSSHTIDSLEDRDMVWGDLWFIIFEDYPDVDVEKEYK